jgi:RNA-directed DNA polymerase
LVISSLPMDRSFVNSVLHALVESYLETSILHKWLKAGFMENQVLSPTEEGTPQGGICSPVLANLALDGLERLLNDTFAKRRYRTRLAKVNMVRFADDFIITASSRELLEHDVQPLVEQFLRERGLELSPTKTVITHIEDGFDFLGRNVRKYRGKLLIKPAQKNVHTFLEKVREIIKGNKQAKAGNLIRMLNPIIRGWALFHRHEVSKRTFQEVDRAIFKALWQWVKRRHSNKSKRWMHAKYFQQVGGRGWTFVGEVVDDDGHLHRIRLQYAADVPIERHIKIRGAANPFDPQWEAYFEQRNAAQMRDTLKGKGRLLTLWTRQKGRCPLCTQAITVETGWNMHHVTWTVLGGEDTLSNCVLLHPICHTQVHYQSNSEAEPRPAKGVRKA